MPVKFGPTISTVVFNKLTGAIAITGNGFGENFYPACQIGYRLTGSVVFNFATIVLPWSDTIVNGTIAIPIPGGWYDVRITSADNEYTDVSVRAFQNPAAARFFFFDNGEKR
jgi:hypothetical protein